MFSDDFLKDLRRIRDLREKRDSEKGQQKAHEELSRLSPDKLFEIAVTEEDKNVPTPKHMGEIEGLIRKHDWRGLEARLGAQTAGALKQQYLDSKREFYRLQDTPGTVLNTIEDTIWSFGDFLGNLAVTAATAVASPTLPVVDRMNEWVGGQTNELYRQLGTGEGLQIYQEAAQNRLSPRLRARQQIQQVKQQAIRREHARERDSAQSLMSGANAFSDWLANQRYGWQGVATGARYAVNDPHVASANVVQGIASLVPAVAGQRTLASLGSRHLNSIARTIKPEVHARQADRIGRAATAVSVGVTEGLGSYGEAYLDVLSRDPEDLLQSSARFRELVNAQSQDPNKDRNQVLKSAQIQLAREAANITFTSVGTTAAAIGALLPEGVQYPTTPANVARRTGASRLGGYAQDAFIREPLEEALQEGSGTLVSNLVTKSLVDPSQDLSEGVGEGVGAGAILGGIVSGTLKSPSAVLGGAQASVEGVQAGAGAIARRQSRRREVRTERESLERMRELDKQSVDIITDKSSINKLNRAAETYIEEASEKGDVDISSLKAELDGTIDALGVTELPDAVRKLDSDLQKRIDGVSRVRAISDVANAFNKETDPVKKAQLGAALSALLEPVQRYKNTPTGLQALAQNPEAKAALEQFQSILGEIESLPHIKKAYEAYQQMVKDPGALDSKIISNPKSGDAKSQQQAQVLAAQAQQNPSLEGTKVTSKQVDDVILAHGEKGDKSLTAAQRKILKGTVAILKAAEAANKNAPPGSVKRLMNSHLEGDRTIASVHQQVVANTDEAVSEGGKYSVRQHLDRIVQAASTGQTELARGLLQRLGKFARSHNNKANALIESLRRGDVKPIAYDQYIPSRDGTKDEFMSSSTNPNQKHKGVWVNPQSKRSMENAHHVAAEADLTTRAHNELAKAFPELGVEAIEGTDLSPISRPTKPPKPKTLDVKAKDLPKRSDQDLQDLLKEAKELDDKGSIKLIEEELKKREEATKTEDTDSKPDEPEETKESTSVEDPVDGGKPTDGETVSDTSPEELSKYAQAGERDALKTGKDFISPNVAAHKAVALAEIVSQAAADAYMAAYDAVKQKQLNERIAAEKEQKSKDEGLVITPEEAKALSDRDIISYYEELSEKDNLTPNEKTTLQVLSDDMDRRGDEADANAPAHPEELTLPTPEDEVGSVFSKLWEITGKTINYFKDSFIFRKKGSRLAGKNKPVEIIQAVLNEEDRATLKEVLGEKNAERVTLEIIEQLNRLLGDDPGRSWDIGALLKHLNEHLQAKLKEKNGTVENLLLEGEVSPHAWAEGKVLNLIEFNEDTQSFQYNQNLAELALLAGIQWVLTQGQRQSSPRLGRLQQEMGLPESTFITYDTLNAIGKGVSPDVAKRQLAAMIRRFWGVEADPSKPKGYTDGIPEAMAAEVIRALSATPLLEHRKVNLWEVQPGLPKKTINRYEAFDWGDESPIYQFPTILEEMIVTDPEKMAYYGDDFVPYGLYNHMDHRVELSKPVVRALNNMNNVQYTLDLNMLNALKDLSDEALIELFGYIIEDESTYNRNDLASKESKNKVLLDGVKELRRMLAEMQNVAESRGVPLEELGRKFAHVIQGNGRAMMRGAYTPQSHKIIREVLLSTWSTLDMSRVGNKDYENFMLAVAQALGRKVHRETRKSNIAWAKNITKPKGELGSVVELLKTYLQNKETNPDEQIPHKAIREGVEKAGVEMSPIVLHALMEVARLKRTKRKDRSKFRTSLYLESDGMTNGPFNTMGLMSLGYFTEKWVINIGRGGLRFGSRPRTSDELLKEAQGDLYKEGVTRAQAIMKNLINSIRNPEVTLVHNHLFSVLGSLFEGDIKFVQGDQNGKGMEITLERGAGKDPMTQMVYGAGVDSVARAMGIRIAREFYSVLSDIASGRADINDHAHLFQSLAFLATVQVRRKKEGSDYKYWVHESRISQRYLLNKMLNEPTTFTFTDAQLDNISTNVRELYMRPMREGIIETLGETVFESAETIIGATKLQTIVAWVVYMREIDKALQWKVDRYVKEGMTEKEARSRVGSEFLSDVELDAVWEFVSNIVPMVSVDGQNMLMSKSAPLLFPKTERKIQADVERLKKADPELSDAEARKIAIQDGHKRHQYSGALDGSLKTTPNMVVISDPEAAGVPYTAIGLGDARMVQKAYQYFLERTTQVFDGINLPIDKIEEYGERINAAALQAWQGNIFLGLLEAYDRMMADPRAQEVLASEQGSQTYNMLVDRGVSPESAVGLRDQLILNAREVQARINTLKQFPISMDQMAATFSPHVSKGKKENDLSDASPEAVAASLNEVYEQEYDKLANRGWPKKASDEKKVAKSAHPSLSKNVTFQRHHTGVMTGPVQALANLARKLKLNTNEKWVLRRATKSGHLAGVRIIIGNAEQIAAFEAAEGHPPYLAQYRERNPRTDVKGMYVPSAKLIYLFEPNVETAVHELVHAATFEMVQAYYDGKIPPGHEADAIKRLERLMEQFLNHGMDGIDPESREGKAILNAQNEINGYIPLVEDPTPKQKAAALNEFMAWTLANRDIEKVLSKTPALVRITRAAWNAIKRLIWGNKRAPDGMGQGTDMMSQIRFNTGILVESRLTVESQISDIALAHSIIKGTDEDNPSRLERITRAFGTLVARHLNESYSPTWAKQAKSSKQVNEAMILADKVVSKAMDHFDLDPLEQSTVGMVVMALATEAHIDPHALTEISKVFEHFLDTVKREDFLTKEQEQDNDPRAEYDAQQKMLFFNEIAQDKSLQDSKGRSAAMSVFLGLAMVNEEFRDVLSRMELAPKVKGRPDSLSPDQMIDAVGAKAMESLSLRLAGMDKNTPVHMKEALDRLSDHIIEQTFKSRPLVDAVIEGARGVTSKFNTQVVQLLEKGAKAATRRTRRWAESDNKLKSLVAKTANVAAATLSEQVASAMREELLAAQDKAVKLPWGLRELLGGDGFIGRVDSQAELYDMYKKVRSQVARERQQYRDDVPELIHSAYEGEGPDARMYDIKYRVMGRADILSLMDGPHRTTKNILKLIIDPKARKQELKKLEAELNQTQNKKYLAYTHQKIDQLVHWMHTNEKGSYFLRNAHAIAHVLGIDKSKDKTWSPPSDRLVQVIDQIATLKYLEKIPEAEMKDFAELVKNEPAGVKYTADFLKGQRDGDLAKISEGRAKFNYYKGMLPQEYGHGHVMVARDSRARELEERGYQRLGKYRGSNIENFKGERFSYFYSPDGGGRLPFQQGLIQNTQGSVYGIHTRTGFSMEPNAGVITDPVEVAMLVKRLKHEVGQKTANSPYGAETLSPIHDENGRVVAFERTIDPEILKKNQVPQHMGKMLGHWRGRQVEESWTDQINDEVLKLVEKQWKEDVKKGDQDRYINVLGSDVDPVIKDAVSLFSSDVREKLKDIFGDENTFMVRRNMVNQLIGYRKASLGDLWTGNTRIPKEFQIAAQDAFTAILGKDAYRKLMKFEHNWQDTINTVRTNIVVRSIVVPAVNIISGIYQLQARGVPLMITMREIPKKVAELEEYTRALNRRVALEAEAHTNPVRARAIEAQIKNLDDRMKRLSIWPLIEAGEFSIIANVGDVAQTIRTDTKNQTWLEQLESAVDELPDALRIPAKYGYIAQDTALFRVLNKSIQYGDFVMKAVYYDHILKHEHELLERSDGYTRIMDEHAKTTDLTAARKAAREAVAMGLVTEEFNNYDLPAGRVRGYAENMGLAWFLNFKIRAFKVGLSMIRNNPVNLLLFSVMPHPLAAGIPVTDSIMGMIASGSTGLSLGPEMLIHPISWNSWYNLAFGD